MAAPIRLDIEKASPTIGRLSRREATKPNAYSKPVVSNQSATSLVANLDSSICVPP